MVVITVSDDSPPGSVAVPTRRLGMALCLSGGGYRAMLYHAGALWRLNDAGLLGDVAFVSSVSGGSITAAYLGLRWSDLAWRASCRCGRSVASL